jgi:hypothetical protein
MDDELSQRERRAQRHRETARKELPKTIATTYGIWLLVAVVVGAAAYGIYKVSTSGQDCPGHFHATFEVYVPGPNGQPQKIDMASPMASNGQHYYDLNGQAGMGLEVHMHQVGAEAGAQDVQPTQWHFEKDGVCVGVQSALHAVEIDADATTVKLFGAHAQVHQDHTWVANATAHVHYFVQAKTGGNWTWSERIFGDVKGYQLQDGESLLVLFGDYPLTIIKQLEAGVPVPSSRT